MSKNDSPRIRFFAALFASLEAVALTSGPLSIRAREFSGASYSSTKRYTWTFHDKFSDGAGKLANEPQFSFLQKQKPKFNK